MALLNSIHHHHPLYLVNFSTDHFEFTCNGCNTLGGHKSYRCSNCDFDLHEFCATCPPVLNSHLHHHSLSIVNVLATGHGCDICGDPVDGLCYTCRSCHFFVHPLCTQLPPTLRHDHHPHHLLTLQKGAAMPCVVCGDVCMPWRYRCDVCRVDVHLECVFDPFGDEPMPNTGGPSQPIFGCTVARSPPPTWAMPSMAFHVDGHGYNTHYGPMGYRYHDYPTANYQVQNGNGPPSAWAMLPTACPMGYQYQYHLAANYQVQNGNGPPPTWVMPSTTFPVGGHGYNTHYEPMGYQYHPTANDQVQNGNGGKKRKRKIFAIVANLAANVVIGTLTGGLLW